MLHWYTFALWGLFGGVIVDGLEIWRNIRANNGQWPQKFRTWSYLIAEIIRLGAGAGLAVAFGQSGQVSGPLGALAIGVATPLIVEKLSQQLPTFDYPLPENADTPDANQHHTRGERSK